MRNKWDPESLRLDSSLVGRVKPKPRRMGKVRGAFLKGPIPVAWLGTAKKNGISALSVGLALWHILGMRKGQLTFPVSNLELARWDVDRKTKYRGLRSLEQAGLISTRQQGRRSVEVTILCAAGEAPGERETGQ